MGILKAGVTRLQQRIPTSIEKKLHIRCRILVSSEELQNRSPAVEEEAVTGVEEHETLEAKLFVTSVMFSIGKGLEGDVYRCRPKRCRFFTSYQDKG